MNEAGDSQVASRPPEDERFHILCDRTPSAYNRAANRWARNVVREFLPMYLKQQALNSSRGKGNVFSQIVKKIRDGDPDCPVKRNFYKRGWVQMTDVEIRHRVGHWVRDHLKRIGHVNPNKQIGKKKKSKKTSRKQLQRRELAAKQLVVAPIHNGNTVHKIPPLSPPTDRTERPYKAISATSPGMNLGGVEEIDSVLRAEGTSSSEDDISIGPTFVIDSYLEMASLENDPVLSEQQQPTPQQPSHQTSLKMTVCPSTNDFSQGYHSLPSDQTALNNIVSPSTNETSHACLSSPSDEDTKPLMMDTELDASCFDGFNLLGVFFDERKVTLRKAQEAQTRKLARSIPEKVL